MVKGEEGQVQRVYLVCVCGVDEEMAGFLKRDVRRLRGRSETEASLREHTWTSGPGVPLLDPCTCNLRLAVGWGQGHMYTPLSSLSLSMYPPSSAL